MASWFTQAGSGKGAGAGTQQGKADDVVIQPRDVGLGHRRCRLSECVQDARLEQVHSHACRRVLSEMVQEIDVLLLCLLFDIQHD